MTPFSFSLLTGNTGPLVKGSQPEYLRIPIHAHTALRSPGDQVLAETKIARANNDNIDDIHAPLAGVVMETEKDAIRIRVTDTSHAPPQSPPPNDAYLKEWLRGMGVNTQMLYPAPTLIINAVPPEPDISIYEPLLRDYRKTVEMGLDTVQHIIGPSRMFLVTARGNGVNAFANCSIIHVHPTYPNGIDQLVIKSVTGQEVRPGARPAKATILNIKELFFIGRVMETGRPVTETVMTMGKQNYLVKIGTPVGWLAREAGALVQPGDKAILGGLMRGTAALNLQQGVGKDTTGLTLLRSPQGNPTNNFCMGCGECERHCPARIMPGMISRCAEFKQFDRTEDFHIHSCIECGLCSYWCKAQRPLLQYIRLAKYELALLRGVTGIISEKPKAGNGGSL